MEDLRGRLSLLRNDAGFQRFIQAADESSGFDRAVSHILERTSGAQLQNLRAFEQAYLFFEIPFASGSPIHHAQIHIFGDPQGKRGGFDANQAAIAMDLSTTHLGDLWVNLSLIRRYCTCAFRACAPQVVAAIEAHGAELTQALTRVGYRGASVYASLWDGNRLQAVAELMQRFAALDARA
jgi:hypothetical protein